MLQGEASGDGLQAVSSADVDADGYADVLANALYNDEGGVDAGAVYVLYGPIESDLDLSAADAKLIGESPGDVTGMVSAAGDVDADGYDDVLVGSQCTRPSGAVYVVYGPVTGHLDLSAADARITSEDAGGMFPDGLASAGDFDADGHADLLIGDESDEEGGRYAGAAWLVYGPVSGDYALSSADAKYYSEVEGAMFGSSVASAGDVDADGRVDLLFGSVADSDAALYAGAAYLVLFADME
jgi:hypothetical protein